MKWDVMYCAESVKTEMHCAVVLNSVFNIVLNVVLFSRLNQRPGPTPPSTLDAISSSTDQPRNNLNRPSLPARRPPVVPPGHGGVGGGHHTHHTGFPDPSNGLLDPADTSSESGSNDSFTCSEFESETDNKIRNDLNHRLK